MVQNCFFQRWCHNYNYWPQFCSHSYKILNRKFFCEVSQQATISIFNHQLYRNYFIIYTVMRIQNHLLARTSWTTRGRGQLLFQATVKKDNIWTAKFIYNIAKLLSKTLFRIYLGKQSIIVWNRSSPPNLPVGRDHSLMQCKFKTTPAWLMSGSADACRRAAPPVMCQPFVNINGLSMWNSLSPLVDIDVEVLFTI